MKHVYVIATQDMESHRLYYETGCTTFHGDIYMGNVLEAKRFDSLAEVCDYIKNSGSNFMLGCSIVLIADVTFEAIEKNKDLFDKYHDPLYVIR